MIPTARPPTLALVPAGLPDLLRAGWWVVWRWAPDENGKLTKPPYWAGHGCPLNLRERDRAHPATYGKPLCERRCARSEHLAATDNPGSWSAFDVAQGRLGASDHRYDGAGLIVTPPLLVVDFDACVDPATGAIEPWARTWVERLASYTEYSVSMTGLHVIVQAQAPWAGAGGSKKIHVPAVPCHGTKDAAMVEVMAHTRYVCVTGVVPDGCAGDVRENQHTINDLWSWLGTLNTPQQSRESLPPGPGSGASARVPAALGRADTEIVQRARHAANGAKFAALFDHGDASAYAGDDSAADLALCSLLAFWTQDEPQLDRIFRSSRLMRPKWEQRHAADGSTYGTLTLRKALAQGREHYSPGQHPPPVLPSGNGHGRAGPQQTTQGLTSLTSLSSQGNGHGDTPLTSLTSLSSQTAQDRPQLDEAAYYGLAGDIVRRIGPQTEASDAALLITLLVYFGGLVSSAPHARVTSKRHGVNLFAVLVGRTSGGRKGTSRAEIEALFRRIDADWLDDRVKTGLSTGEGLISAVRDATKKTNKDGSTLVLDEGIEDKRLLVIEEEFCSPIKLMAKEGNTLSALVRQSWDGHNLGTLTRNNAMTASKPHVCILGHTTQTELLKYLTETEMADGFANRFLWVCVERSKLLPHGGSVVDYGDTLGRLAEAVRFARGCAAEPVGRSAAANALWEQMYADLTAERAGMFGGVTSRAEAQALRLSVLYALLDHSPVVQAEHLVAALALWEYCQDSARTIFGAATGDHVADRIVAALRQAGAAGVDLEAMTGLFSGHIKASRRDDALTRLVEAGLAHYKTMPTAGRDRTVYYAGPATAESAK